MPTRIVKVGGSLLNWPSLPQALNQWLATQSRAMNVLIAGGGSVVDVIRRADRDFSLGEEVSHWLCIDAMSVTARVLAAVVSDARLVTTFEALLAETAAGSVGNAVFDPREFLREHENHLPGRVLPHDWRVTSDSIAARVAEVVAAEELVLLKSSDPPGAIDGWATAGYVDACFPMAAHPVGTRAINLRRILAQEVLRTEY